jgi:hypothetical protein
MQHLTKGFRTTVRQSHWAQGSAQAHQRPDARLILLVIWLPLYLGENACVLLAGVGRLAATTNGDGKDGETTLVEAADQAADRLIALLAGLPGSFRVGCSCSDG